MIFVEGYYSVAISESIDRKLQVVVQPDATVRDDVRIAQHYYSSQTVRIVDQQCAVLICNVRDRSGRTCPSNVHQLSSVKVGRNVSGWGSHDPVGISAGEAIVTRDAKRDGITDVTPRVSAVGCTGEVQLRSPSSCFASAGSDLKAQDSSKCRSNRRSSLCDFGKR